MAVNRADYTNTFRLLCICADEGEEADGPVRALFADPAAFDAWAVRWRQRLAREAPAARAAAMRAVNPAYIPRNHRVDVALAMAQTQADFSLFEELLQVLAKPYDDQPHFAHYANPPAPHEIVEQTFCGT
jgi:uncharacterized protein YdiU (UPF0061 family)